MNVWKIHNVGVTILAGGLAVGAPMAFAQGSSNIPDAQVESNVLKALASTSDLANQNIQSTTVYGTVTLTGNVHNDQLRTEAENLVARAQGVKKVVDELTIGDAPAQPGPDEAADAQTAAGQQPDPGQGNQPVLQSDGTYAPSPDGSGAAPAPNQNPNGAPGPGYPQPAPGYQGADNQQAYGQQPGYGPGAPPPPGRQPMQNQYAPPPGVPGGQQAGIPVTVPAGAVLRVRIDRGLDSQHVQPGTNFTGTVLTDVVADNAVAIPRGAQVTGVVVDAKKAGVFKGEGELALQINSLTLGGHVYPLQSEVWQRNGRDKTAGTVNNTAGGAAIGALFGALAGGGTGAAVGAGVGGGLGLAGSAASPRGQIIVPPESVLTFRTAAPVGVKTVSEQEMGRLSYAAGPQQPPQPRMRRYYSPYYGYYYAPGPPPPQE
jgi:hypothetical protein